jgi:hypothetical protein
MLVTGMIIGSAFTLFVVPSIYVLLARTHTANESVELTPGEGFREPFPLPPLPVYQSSAQEVSQQ